MALQTINGPHYSFMVRWAINPIKYGPLFMLYLLVYIIKHTTDAMFYLKLPARSKVNGQKRSVKSGRQSRKMTNGKAADLIRNNLCNVGYVVRVWLMKPVTRCFWKLPVRKLTVESDRLFLILLYRILLIYQVFPSSSITFDYILI